MITKEVNSLGFSIIKLDVSAMFKLGGICICDSCNSGMFTGAFIGALNRVYCDECYEEFLTNATYYEEDRPFETSVINTTLKKLNK